MSTVAPRNSSANSSSCLTAPKAGVGADDGQAGDPRSCGAGVSWCNGIALPNASACAAACCAIEPTGASTAVCGGYTFDPNQAGAGGGVNCPAGGSCCWLKQAPSALGEQTLGPDFHCFGCFEIFCPRLNKGTMWC